MISNKLTKKQRQSLILDVINNQKIRTHQDLVNFFKIKGFKVPQATISRDIKELDLYKIKDENGDYYYQSRNVEDDNNSYQLRIKSVFKESVKEITSTKELVIIKTLPGMAQAAAHVVDNLELEAVAGSIAGDDTVFIAVKEDYPKEELIDKFLALKND